MAYDLVSSQYGWSDDVIGELPLARFRQITSAIQLRKFREDRETNHRFSWMTRNIATFIASGYMVEGENKAVDVALKLALDDIERAQLDWEETAMRDLPAEDKNANGSFEKFLMFSQAQATGKG